MDGIIVVTLISLAEGNRSRMNRIKVVAPLLTFLAIVMGSTPSQEASAISPVDASRDRLSLEPQLSPLPQDQATPRHAPMPEDNPPSENLHDALQNDLDRSEAH